MTKQPLHDYRAGLGAVARHGQDHIRHEVLDRVPYAGEAKKRRVTKVTPIRHLRFVRRVQASSFSSGRVRMLPNSNRAGNRGAAEVKAFAQTRILNKNSG